MNDWTRVWRNTCRYSRSIQRTQRRCRGRGRSVARSDELLFAFEFEPTAQERELCRSLWGWLESCLSHFKVFRFLLMTGEYDWRMVD